jgi:hypothetical protein
MTASGTSDEETPPIVTHDHLAELPSAASGARWGRPFHSLGAKMNPSEPNRPNHMKLSQFHIGLAIAYAVLFGSLMLFGWSDLTASGKIGVPIMSVFPPLFHLGLAWGSKVKSEISRKISVAVGVLLLIAFPVGTILGFFFLPLTQWNTKPGSENAVS